MSDFHVGQEVVCVNDAPMEGQGPGYLDGLKAGAHYTVRWVGNGTSHWSASYSGVRVAEIMRPARGGDPEPDVAFVAERFRPVKADAIAIFRRMCVEAKSGRKLVDVEP